MIRNVVAAVILGIAVAGLAWTFGQPGGTGSNSQAVSLKAQATGPAPRVGELAPDFQAYQLDGTSVRLSDFRGRPVWLNFWATWCPPCRQESPEIEAAYQKFRDAGVVVLAVDMGEDPRTVQDYVQRARLSYTIALDPGTDIAAMYRVAGLPYHFFIGGDGILREWRMGRLGQEKIEKSIAAILPAGGAGAAGAPRTAP